MRHTGGPASVTSVRRVAVVAYLVGLLGAALAVDGGWALVGGGGLPALAETGLGLAVVGGGIGLVRRPGVVPGGDRTASHYLFLLAACATLLAVLWLALYAGSM